MYGQEPTPPIFIIYRNVSERGFVEHCTYPLKVTSRERRAVPLCSQGSAFFSPLITALCVILDLEAEFRPNTTTLCVCTSSQQSQRPLFIGGRSWV